MPLRWFHPLCIRLAPLAVLAACVPAAPTVPARVALAPPVVRAEGQGVIVAERPVPPSDATVRRLVLARLGAAPVGAPPPGPAGLVEFVVRDGLGRTLSVVQANPGRLRPGDRVAINWRDGTVLLPAATEVATAPAR